VTESTPYDSAADADPEVNRWGFFSVDPWVGGAGVLLWFASPEEMLRTIREGEVSLYLADDDAAADALRTRIDAALEGLGRDGDPHAILADLDDICEADVLWVGTLDDLMVGDNEWACDLRATFRRDDAEDDDVGPISPDEQQAFVAFVREYVEA